MEIVISLVVVVVVVVAFSEYTHNYLLYRMLRITVYIVLSFFHTNTCDKKWKDATGFYCDATYNVRRAGQLGINPPSTQRFHSRLAAFQSTWTFNQRFASHSDPSYELMRSKRDSVSSFDGLAFDDIEWSQIGHLMNFTQRIIFIMEWDWNVEWG